MIDVDEELARRLLRQANGERWRVSLRRFAEALARSAVRAFGSQTPDDRAVARYFDSLHLDDLALACACADGDEQAWEHFIRELRPALYRAADAIDPNGGARDLADSLYADLFGVRGRGGERQPLLHYFHGRSRLTTWLRAMLAQRHVDRLRSTRRDDALPDEESAGAFGAQAAQPDPKRGPHAALLREALASAVAALPPRDRLRLGCYYGQELTLKQTGRMLGEHEATVSRQLARTRTQIRTDVTRRLLRAHLSGAEIAQCFEDVVDDAGSFDLRAVLQTADERKKPARDRSPEEKTS